MGIDPHTKPTFGLILWGSILPSFLGLWLVFLPNFSIIAAGVILLIYLSFWAYFVSLYRQERFALARLGFLGLSSLFFLGFPLRLSPQGWLGLVTTGLAVLTYAGFLAIVMSNVRHGTWQDHSQSAGVKINYPILIGGTGTAVLLITQSLVGSFAPVRIFLAVAGYLCACGFGWLTVRQYAQLNL